ERQACIERGISRRRDARCQRDGGELHTTAAQCRKKSPVERKACRRWLEGDRNSRDRRPHVPQCESSVAIGVLNRAALPRYAGPHGVGFAFEFQGDEALVSEQACDRGDERSKREAIAECKRRWRWTVFGARSPIAGAEHHRREAKVFVREGG